MYIPGPFAESDALRMAEFVAGRAEPWAVSDAPGDYIDKMLQSIVGLTLTVTEVTAKTKASQNRTPADQRGVLEGLREDPATAAAAALIEARFDPR